PRKQAEDQVRLSRDTLLAEFQVLAGIIRSEAFSGSDTEQTIRSLLEADARQQLVERVSLWLFVQEGTAIRCFDLYELPQDRHTSGMGIEKQDYPAYFEALLSEEAIVADDAHSHSATRDFSASYLTPLGISSMLDVPIHIHGKLAGVLCHERVGSPIVWSPEQRLFAISIANLVSLALEQGERNRVEEERNKLQDQLLQVQKMDAIGRLAGGVAHDFNNMLQAILGHVDIALRAELPESPLKGDLLAIRQAAMRSADLTRQLLAFARKQTIDPKVLDLNDTVSSMLRMLQRLIGENIQLIWTPGYRLWRVRIDPTQVNQILANLTVNARDAISGVGRLTIETSNATLDEAYCEERVGFVPGEYVRLSVSDTGCGMSKETVEQIFEPFFTTKGIGEGTGLGLATVYGIVKQNEGFIQVQSELGQGASFQIFFPRCGSDLVDQTPSSEPEPPRGGTETILLVEDEPAILLIGRRILEEFGYTVLVASCPGEALELAANHPGEIHLLITDVVMPEMDGRELGNRLHAVRPSMKLLFMSGYTANIIAHRGILEAGIRFIPKPFNITDLGKKVREALDS
ncbi:MAG: response regulator, partial [Candidatus Omnitrophica bacterium]|nr:response regulator [Candidatus Omnitrophota bacterium]